MGERAADRPSLPGHLRSARSRSHWNPAPVAGRQATVQPGQLFQLLHHRQQPDCGSAAPGLRRTLACEPSVEARCPAWCRRRLMDVTGIVFTLLLSGTDVDTAIPWVNTVVHELMPLLLLADWLLGAPVERLSVHHGLLWLSFPLAWIVYTLIRGSISGLYPYPFLNPVNGGYASVAGYSFAVLVLMALVCAAVLWLGNTRNAARTVGQPI